MKHVIYFRSYLVYTDGRTLFKNTVVLVWKQTRGGEGLREASVTYRIAFSIVVSRKWIKGSQLHPSSAQFFCGVSQKSTDVCSNLEDMVVFTQCWPSTLPRHPILWTSESTLFLVYLVSCLYSGLLKCFTIHVCSFLSTHIIIILCSWLPSFPHLSTHNAPIANFRILFDDQTYFLSTVCRKCCAPIFILDFSVFCLD